MKNCKYVNCSEYLSNYKKKNDYKWLENFIGSLDDDYSKLSCDLDIYSDKSNIYNLLHISILIDDNTIEFDFINKKSTGIQLILQRMNYDYPFDVE